MFEWARQHVKSFSTAASSSTVIFALGSGFEGMVDAVGAKVDLLRYQRLGRGRPALEIGDFWLKPFDLEVAKSYSQVERQEMDDVSPACDLDLL